MAIARVLPVLLLAGASSCASPPEPQPLMPPAALATVRYRDESLGADADAAFAGARLVSVTWLVLEKLPAAVLESVPATAPFLATTTGPRPFLAAASLFDAARFGSIADAATFRADLGVRHAPIATAQALLLKNATTIVELGAVRRAPGDDARASVALDLRGDGSTGAVEVSAVLTQVGAPPAALAAEELDATGAILPALQRELALLDRRERRPCDRWALVIASPFAARPPQAIAAIVEITAADASDAAARAAAQASYRAALVERSPSSVPASLPAVPSSSAQDVPAAMATAVEALADASHQRRALCYLASATDSALVLDLALAVEAPELEELASAMRAALGAQGATQDLGAVRFALEQRAWRMLTAQLEKSEVTPVLDAILVRHAGEAGRHHDVLSRVLASAHGSTELDAALVGANREFLDDTSLAARARAFDWLARRELAPVGFEPMGASKDRRAVLERDADARAAAPAGRQP
ncbi:MAG: hypothetical protein U1E76_23350 [Planctomycetota bacterium]